MRVGIDTGGALTDVVMNDEASGRSRTFKTPSTPEDPTRACNGRPSFCPLECRVAASDSRDRVMKVLGGGRAWTLRREHADTGR